MDNDAAEEQYRQEFGLANAVVRADSELPEPRGPPSETYAALFTQFSGWISVALVCIAICIGVFVVALIVRESWHAGTTTMNHGNCSVIQCPAGPVGPQGIPGVAGPVGAQGEQGIQGTQGAQGVQGLPGQEGPMGQCSNNNPQCQRGATGAQGVQGIPGPTGTAGLPGLTGPQGLVGPQGQVGPQGEQGIQGIQGIQGVQGIPGVCNCLNLSLVTLVNLGVSGNTELNGTVTVNGVMTCPGGAMDSSCFGLAVCPDFTPCVLSAQGLNIFSTNMSVIPTLAVGTAPGDQGNAVVIFGNGPGSSVQQFQTYVEGSWLAQTASTPMVFQSLLSSIQIECVGSPVLPLSITSSGTITANGVEGVQLTTLKTLLVITPTASVQVNGLTGVVSVIGINASFVVTDFLVRKTSTVSWFETFSTTTLTCAPGAPLATAAGSSIHMNQDVVMGVGTHLVSADADAYLRMSSIELCGTTLKTTAGTLQLQDNTTAKTLDVRAIITNTEGVSPIVFNDLQGANFQNTALFNQGANPLTVDDNALITGDLDVTGDVTVMGTLDAISCSGCVSDERVKHSIRSVEPEEDLRTILALPRRVRFQYTEAYTRLDRRAAGPADHDGYIAQELERVLPRVVYQSNRTLADGVAYPDLRRVMYERMVPFLVGAVQALSRRCDELETELRAIKQKV